MRSPLLTRFALAALLLATFTLAGGPVSADPPADWPGGAWPVCADDDAQYCIESAVVTPVGGVATPAATLGLSATVNTLGGYVTSFNWSVAGFDADGISKDVRSGLVELTVRTGPFHPRYTMALAKDLRIDRSVDKDTGNSRIVLSGHVVQIDWTTGDLFASCVAGSDCGDADTMADAIGTGSRFIGNTQDLETGDQDYVQAFDGFYLSSDAQARPTVVQFATYPEPYWYLSVLGNPHLDMNGVPVRGSFNAFVPGNYFTGAGTTAKAAAAIGFDVQGVDAVTGATVSIPATVTELDGGVMLDVPDLGYSIQRVNVYNRASTAPVDDTVPGAPRTVTATAAGGGVQVGWLAPLSDGGAAISSYKARAFTAATGGTVAGDCTAATLACTITGLPAGAEYHVSVTATNIVGEGAPNSSRTAVTVPATKPGVPGKVTAAGGPAKITVGWAAPADPGSSPLTGYTATAQPGGQQCAAPAGTTTCELTGLTNGTTYTVTVKATSDAGDSPASDPASATPAAPTLPATVPAGDGPLDSGTGTTFTPDSRTTTLTGSGFAPNSPVTVGIYSTPAALVTTTADAGGNVSVQVTIPAGYTGGHTLAISGIAPGGGPRVLTLGVTVAAAAAALPVTGPPAAAIAGTGLVLLLAGAVLALALRRPRPVFTA